MSKKASLVPAKTDPIASLVQQVSLVDLRLIGCTILNAAIDAGLPGNLEQKINVGTARGDDKHPNCLTCIITITMVGNHAETTLPKGLNALQIEARYAALYSFESLEGIDDSALQEFGQRNALFNIWPFWREFLQSMTVRMGLPPLTVPLMRPASLVFKRDGVQADTNKNQPKAVKKPKKKKKGDR